MAKTNLIGQRFGRLTVISEAGRDKYKNVLWHCKCDCGNEVNVVTQSLKGGTTKSCGCYKREKNYTNLVGKKFGRLTVIADVGRSSDRSVIWLCECECGNRKLVRNSYALKAGLTRSCGCLHSEIIKKQNSKHNMSRTRLYKIWNNARTRCNNPNTPYYFKYGGRGIRFTDEWLDFEVFKEWAFNNGYQDDLTLDRIDVNGNYEPSNCRWITNAAQQLNKRTNHILTYAGKSQTIKEWADELGIKYKTLCARVDDYHWSDEKALTTPVKTRKKKG